MTSLSETINRGKYKPRPGIMCNAPGCPHMAAPGDAFLCAFHAQAPIETWDQVTKRIHTKKFENQRWMHTMLLMAKARNDRCLISYIQDWQDSLIALGMDKEQVEMREEEGFDQFEERVGKLLLDFIAPAVDPDQTQMSLVL